MKNHTKKNLILGLLISGIAFTGQICNAQIQDEANIRGELNLSVTEIVPEYAFQLSPIIDYDAYLKLAVQVKELREKRLISLDTFLAYSKQPHTVILDTRSDSLYEQKHLAGAIHLDFTNFTQDNLDRLIPDRNTRILIYCNNNFKDRFMVEPDFFVSKVAMPLPRATQISPYSTSLALNIPTFINLVGYGFNNVFELGEQVYISDEKLKFEGKSVD